MPTRSELEQMIDDGHVGHEVRGILVAIPPPPLDSRIAEAALLHLRAVAFFLADTPKGDDVGALGYEPRNWQQPTREHLLGRQGDDALNKRLSHLTTRRLNADFDWMARLQRIPGVVDEFERFVDALDTSWQPRFAAILREISIWRETRPSRPHHP